MQITKCQCGAITVQTNEYSNSVLAKNFNKFFPDLTKPRKAQYYQCNHCINHYGLDICACGSGESPEKCKEGYDNCGKPREVQGESIPFTGWVF